MDRHDKQEFIRRAARQDTANPSEGRIQWSRHALVELAREGWSIAGVEEGLKTCEVIEEYPAVRRWFPDCLVLGWLSSGAPLHAVVGLDEAHDRLLVVTV